MAVHHFTHLEQYQLHNLVTIGINNVLTNGGLEANEPAITHLDESGHHVPNKDILSTIHDERCVGVFERVGQV